MKKKYRDIIINDIKYRWIVDGDNEGIIIKIYKNKKEIYNKYTFGHKDIRPIIIKEIITINHL